MYNSSFRYEWSPYDITPSDSGIDARVVRMLDYGAEMFAECKVGDETLYIKTDKPLDGAIKLAPDVSKVSVIESERQIRIV